MTAKGLSGWAVDRQHCVTQASAVTKHAVLDRSAWPRHAGDAVSSDPVLIAYTVKHTKSGRAIWTRIGAAYPHDTGAGLTLILDALPPDGRIILLEPDDADHERLLRAARREPRGREH